MSARERGFGKILTLLLVGATLAIYPGCRKSSKPQSDQAKASDFDHTFEPFLAHDVKTGEYLGVVIMECRDWETKKPISYRVRLQDGRTVDKPAGSITIDLP